VHAANLTIAEKIKSVRLSMDIKQEALAQAIGIVRSKISDAESGKREYTREQVDILRKLLRIEGAPLYDSEIAYYEKQLDLWREYIKEARTYEAAKMHEKLSVITKLPYERDLTFHYRMFEAKLFMETEEFSAAEEVLENAKPLLDETTAKNRYHYHYNMGMFNFYKVNYMEAKNFYKTAFNMNIEGFGREPSLYYNLALCYSRLGMAVLSVSTILDVYNRFRYDKTSELGLFLDNTLAVNRIRLNQIEQAKETLCRALERATIQDNRVYIGCALHNYGYAYMREGNFEVALEYFRQQEAYFTEGDDIHLENLYQKIRCLMALKKKALCKPLILLGADYAKDSRRYSILFQSLSHLLNMNDEALQFIEDKTIPCLIENHELSRALEFCEELILTYTKKDLKIKTLESIAIKSNILYRITFGDDTY